MGNFKILHILVLSLIFSFYNCQQDPGEDIFSQIKVQNIKSPDEIDRLKNTTDMTYFVYYYKKSSKTSRMIAPILILLSNKLEHIAEILMVDCDQESFNKVKICDHPDKSKDIFPRMMVLVPPEFRFNPYTKKLNNYVDYPLEGSQVSESILFNFITKYVISRATKLTSNNIDTFLNDKSTNKIILFTKQPKTPLMYRGLSSLFYDRLSFGEVKDSEKDLVERFNITKFPSVVSYVNFEEDFALEEPRIDLYNGEINIKDAKAFIEKYALPYKLYLKMGTLTKSKSEVQSFFKSVGPNEITSFVNRNLRRNVILLVRNDTEIPKYLEDLAYLTQGFFLFGVINCQKETQFCHSTFKNLKQYPTIYQLPKGDDYNKRMRNLIELPNNLKGIVYEIFNEFQTEMKEGTQSNLNQLLYSARENNKIPLLFVYNDDYVNPGLYLMSTEKRYNEAFEFIVMSNPNNEVKKQLSIQKLPATIILIQTEQNPQGAQLIQMRYDTTYLNLRNFLDQFIPAKKEEKKEAPKTNTKIEISFINSNEDFRTYCYNKNKPCLIGFLDARDNEKSKKSLEESLKVLENVTNSVKGRSYTYSWVNSTCQFDLTDKFNVQIDSIPNVVIYYPQQEIFSNLIGIFDLESITRFQDIFIQGKTPLNSLKINDINFSNLKCEEVKERKSIEEEDDEILKEIVEAEKKKREEFEKDRAKTRNTKKRRRRRRRKDL